MTATTLRIAPEELRAAMVRRFEAAGLADSMAEATAQILLEADLLGHRTHGVAMVQTYCDAIEDGSMARSGEPEVLSKRGASEFWQGNRIAGAWLTLKAIDRAEEMARDYGTGTIVMRRSFHIGALAAYLEAVAKRGLVLLLQTSAPHAATVAPFGGCAPVISPSPLAIGYPSGDTTVLIDISTSVTSNSLVRRTKRENKRLPHPWVIRPDGQVTDDPGESETILPLGGLEAGHKGFGMALMVEALTAGLAATGRNEPSPNLGASVFVQVIDPEAFGGLDGMAGVMGHMSDLCHAAEPISPDAPVRLPGEAALKRKAEQLSNGVIVSAQYWDQVKPNS
ncbi:Ldh family oxidoreductase [Notoacmeibacter sp. MSK16QG-6]|uniref:Ldh family oxidoreductase n=1 Tax=Notoacmeibacter sp. MSK16QG-6 TaxID=2957982 RepID=UPI00209FA4A0|nr:Ldh family oxidoreductase [Notoacmeibacter sp. MSK16QG-6]MCP1199544.1 Ldh family oxidoreductase [Notoacmeibacter sp. MSK16QG-6]